MDIVGQADLTLFAVAAHNPARLDLERIERVNVALGIDNAPGGGGRVGDLEIIGDLQHRFAVLMEKGGHAGIGLGAGELVGLFFTVGLGGERRSRSDHQSAEDGSRQNSGNAFHDRFSLVVFWTGRLRCYSKI